MLISFILATILITLMPGPSMLLVIFQALQHRLSQALLAAAGVVAADAILLALTISGLGPILHSSALLFEAVKWAGVIYLLYLGWQQIQSQAIAMKHSEDVQLDKQHQKYQNHSEGTEPYKQQKGAFWQAFSVTMLNPKIIGFFIAFFPQFIAQDQALWPQLMILAPLFLLVVFLVLAVYALLANQVAPWLQSAKASLWLNRSGGVTLIGCGLAASTLSRSA
ncbi:LysE family translocator [Oceanospirillum sediminis]|uniref:LysE family translocator n=1 Tax=Oceanospirillum sediminis TaxID=2760088 RepID=A0A839IP43_9GAMM|nr:LysE family translocator [Oceanospirillum sediminis]MBB1486681.1 LysE family translocator [Oceanospirillum sediminis]